MTPTSGSAICARRQISPGPFMPSSRIAASSVPARRSSVSGRPTRLFCVPLVRTTLHRLPQEGVPVVRLAAEGDEELVQPEAPAVGRDPREAGAGAQANEIAAGGGEDLLQGERRRCCLGGLAHPSLPRARRTSS